MNTVGQWVESALFVVVMLLAVVAMSLLIGFGLALGVLLAEALVR